MKAYQIILIIAFLSFIPEFISIYKLFSSTFTKPELPRLSFRINVYVFIFGSIFTLVSILFDINFLNYKSPVEHKDFRSIKLNDFNAIGKPNLRLDGMKEFAFIYTQFFCDVTDSDVEIRALFHPSRSYVFNKSWVDENLLRHELYHFHITEINARYLREEIIKLNDTVKKSKISEIFKKYKNRERSMQIAYDDITYHGYILGVQKNEEKKIDSLLNILEPYSKTSIKIRTR